MGFWACEFLGLPPYNQRLPAALYYLKYPSCLYWVPLWGMGGSVREGGRVPGLWLFFFPLGLAAMCRGHSDCKLASAPLTLFGGPSEGCNLTLPLLLLQVVLTEELDYAWRSHLCSFSILSSLLILTCPSSDVLKHRSFRHVCVEQGILCLTWNF